MERKYNQEKNIIFKMRVGSFLVLLFLLGLFCVQIFAAEQASFLGDRHKSAGLTCEDCHEKGPKAAVFGDKCLGCHESYTKLAVRTVKLKPNPHDNHLLDLDCTKCHQSHKAQENYCHTCHSDLEFQKLPEK